MKSMNQQRRKNLKMSLPALCAATLLAACGGGGDSGVPPPVVSAATTSTVRYGDSLLITLVGSGLDQALSLSSFSCKNFVRSSTAPNISSATTAYYNCTVSGATGARSISVSGGGVTAASVPITVPVPEVTMIVSNGAGVAGTLVITLAPERAPITVDNFLAYVRSGFYNGTAFHRNGRSATGGDFVLQGGGYNAPISATALFPAPKPVNAPIALESGLSNLRYTVAMARTSMLNSATSEFFINTANNAFLDTSGGGYAAFGTVTTGVSLVDAMSAAPCNVSTLNFGAGSIDCVPQPNLVIASAQQTR